MQAVHCNYCGQDNWQLVNEGPDLGLNRGGSFRLVCCRNCGLIYQNPQPTREELPQFYPDEYALYQTDTTGGSRVAELSQQHAMSRRCQRVLRHVPTPGVVVDVGCATGQFLQAMVQQGWQAVGVELSEYAADHARNAGLDVHTGTLEEASLPASQFDLVTLWDVFEHVLDPQETLAEIGRVLKPGGFVVIHTPNPTCLEARLFGSNWIGWERPRHLHLYTPDVLRAYLQDAGFELVSIESFSGRLSVTLLSVEYALKARGMPEAKWRPWLKLA
jgi:SAM-dependent methyltransferase